MLQINSRKPVVLSINLLSKDLMVQPSKETRSLEDQLRTLNQRWDRVCAKASVWFSELQIELMQCGGFHEMIDELLSWLNATEQEIRRQEPVDFSSNHQLLQLKYNKFKVRMMIKFTISNFRHVKYNILIPPCPLGGCTSPSCSICDMPFCYQ